MERCLLRKTSISLPLSDSNSSDGKNSNQVYSFKHTIKCVSENNILFMKNQCFSQESINEITFSNQDIIWNDKPKSIHQIDYKRVFNIKSQFYVGKAIDDQNFYEETEEEIKLECSEERDYLPSSFKSIIKNNDRDFKRGEVFLSDSNDTLDILSNLISSDNKIDYPTHKEQGVQQRKISFHQNVLNYEINSLNSADFIKSSEEEKFESSSKSSELENQINYVNDGNQINLDKEQLYLGNEDKEEVNSFVSYYSFNREITKWKENNWLLDQNVNENNQQSKAQENSTKKEKINNNPINILKKIVSLCNLNFLTKKNPENRCTESEESFLSFSSGNIRKNRKTLNQNKDETRQHKDDSFFYENTEWLDDFQNLDQDTNYNQEDQIFQQQQHLELETNLISSNSSKQLINKELKNPDSSTTSILELKDASDGLNLHQKQIHVIQQNTYNDAIRNSTQENVAKDIQSSQINQQQQLYFSSCSYETQQLAQIQLSILRKIQSASNQLNKNSGEIIRDWKKSNFNQQYFDQLANSSSQIFEDQSKLYDKYQSQKNIIEKEKNQSDQCEICLTPYNDAQKQQYSMKCQHFYCKECFILYMKQCYDSGKKFYEIKCPQEDCNTLASMTDLSNFFSLQQISNLSNQITNEFILLNNLYSVCPSLNCSVAQKIILQEDQRYQRIFDNRIQRNVFCPECQFDYCNLCKRSSHLPLTCNQYNQLKLLFNQEWISQNTKKCPNCFINIEKNDGCNHMTCQYCHFEFCWICMQQFLNSSHICQNINTIRQIDPEQTQDIARIQYYSEKNNIYKESIIKLKNQIREFLNQFQNQSSNDLSDEKFKQVLKIERAYNFAIFAQQFNQNLSLLLYLLGQNNSNGDIVKKQTLFQQNIYLLTQSLQKVQDSSQSYSKSYLMDQITHQVDSLIKDLEKIIYQATHLNSTNINHPQMYVLSFLLKNDK